MEKSEIDFFLKKLKSTYPDAKTTLRHTNAFDLLIAVILSAQSTDKKINEITKELAPITPESLLNLGEEKIKKSIKPAGFQNAKTKALLGCAKKLKSKKVPSSFEELTSLPGVGGKTAQVLQSQWFKIPAFPVDTHIHRVANRIGITKSKNSVSKTENGLKEKIPKKDWIKTHIRMIKHGREICTARKPKCEICPLTKICESYPRLLNNQNSKAKKARGQR